MLGSSRREKGVKIYGEFDWWHFYSNVNCLGWNPYSRCVSCSKLYGTFITIILRQKSQTEKLDRLGIGNDTFVLCKHKFNVIVQYMPAYYASLDSNNFIYYAVLFCLVAYATVLINYRE